MRCCIHGSLIAEVDDTGGCKLRPGDWSKQPAAQTKNDINIVKRNLFVYDRRVSELRRAVACARRRMLG